MKHFFFFLLLVSCNPKTPPQTSVFRFHQHNEPVHLDPARYRASSSNYLFFNIFRGLYIIDAKNELQEQGGRCLWKTKQLLECEILEQFWSTGKPVSSTDYKRSFLRLIDPATASPRSHLLSEVVNGREILMGLKEPRSLGFQVLSHKKFQLKFAKPDPEFLYKLASTALYPLHSSMLFQKEDYKKKPSNGPYLISDWKPGQKLFLSPNPYYKKGHADRPEIEVLFVDDDKTALRLYDKKQLNFLRRVPSGSYSLLSDRKDFFLTPMLRFDYIGFGPILKKKKFLRQALALSINYNQLKKILKALGRPGCPSTPKEWIKKDICIPFAPKKAQQALQKVPSKNRPPLRLKVSKRAGEDIKKQAEFFQSQWKNHIQLNVEIQQVDQKVFLHEVRNSPPPLFRKGVGLDRPTCLSALETFSQDSKQNFIGLQSETYWEILEEMKNTWDSPRYSTLCEKGIEFLIDNFHLIPLGEMYFGMMADPQFTGWTMNGMNLLDLSQLHPTQSPSP